MLLFNGFRRYFHHSIRRSLPRAALSTPREDKPNFALIKSNEKSSSPANNVVFNDYQLVEPKKSIPKLIDVQRGLNEYLKESDPRTLITLIQNKFRLFDVENVATLVQRVHELNIQRDSKELIDQRLYEFLDYFILKHGPQFDFAHVLTMFFQLSSLNGTAPLNSPSPGSYALKGLIQLLKHNVNKYHLEDIGRILLALERDLHCDIEKDSRLQALVEGLFLLTKFRENELDRLDARALAELAYAFARKLDHRYFTNLLTEYLRDEYHHDYHSTMLIFRALNRRAYRHNRTLDACLHFVHENKELFTDQDQNEIKEYLNKLDYNTLED